jgi:cytochrome c5
MKSWLKVFTVLGLSTMLVGTAFANMSTEDKKIMERTQPVAQVCVEGDACAQPANATANTAGVARSGKEIFGAVCTACHSTGAMGAPKIGNKEEWAPRIAKGMDTLLKHALHGFNAMPPKGTCTDCTDAEIKSTIEYMVSQSK